MKAALLADLVEWALSRDPGSDAGVRVEMPNLGRVVRTYSMGWELDEASGLVLTFEIPETPCMSEWGEADQEGARGSSAGPWAHTQMAIVDAQINSGNPPK